MSEDERQAIITSMFEGILAAYHATAHEGNSEFENCHTFALTALANLEADGFKVVRNAQRP